jgi:hypothetical protein
MVGLNRETLTLAGIIVCLVTCFYLYKENQKQKEELNNFTTKVVSQLSHVPSRNDKKPVRTKTPAVEEVNDDDDDEDNNE